MKCFIFQVLLSNIDGYIEKHYTSEGIKITDLVTNDDVTDMDNSIENKEVTQDEIGQRILTALKQVLKIFAIFINSRYTN